MHAKPKRILVCGGRKYHNREHLDQVMHKLRPFFGWPFCIINGGAPGADSMAEDWALSKGYPCITMNAPWRKLGNGAGTVRNTWMLDWAMPDLVIALPGGVGTADMKEQARGRGIPVYEG
jgi:predicted Rossmann-fold nucleotide-binding protein